MNKIKKLLRYIPFAVIVIVSFVMLGFFIKGDKGNPVAYQTLDAKSENVAGPYESSNSRSRYILTESLVEKKTPVLTEQDAKFASPDVSQYKGKFFSIFMPGISFIGIPFYMLGKLMNTPQLVTYLSVTLFGFINMLLIARIAYTLGVNKYASMLGGFLFLFGTNALPYAMFFTQHITTVTFMLLSLLLAMRKPSVLNAILFGAAFGASMLLDMPNILLMLPIAVYFVTKYVQLQKNNAALKLTVNPKVLLAIFGILPFIAVLGWYNFQTTGSYTKIGQTVGQSMYFTNKAAQIVNKNAEKKVEESQTLIPFTPRSQITGLYTLLLSDERSWLFYSPVVLLGIFGLIELYKKERNRAIMNVLTGVVLLNIVLYSMFDDPWGGWAYGPRYLIPAASMMCIALAVAIQTYIKKFWFVLVLAFTALGSIAVNVLGALTTSAIPPKAAAEALLDPIPYTPFYNVQLAENNVISSLVYKTIFSHTSGMLYIIVLACVLGLMAAVLYRLAYMERKSNYDA